MLSHDDNPSRGPTPIAASLRLTAFSSANSVAAYIPSLLRPVNHGIQRTGHDESTQSLQGRELILVSDQRFMQLEQCFA